MIYPVESVVIDKQPLNYQKTLHNNPNVYNCHICNSTLITSRNRFTSSLNDEKNPAFMLLLQMSRRNSGYSTLFVLCDNCLNCAEKEGLNVLQFKQEMGLL